MAAHTSCPLCGSDQLALRWEVNGYPIASCGNCSLLFVQKIVSPDELALHYATSKDPTYDEDNLECLSYYYRRLRKVIEKHHPGEGRLLDVGCSGGWFFDEMTGWECYGNEIESSYANRARERHGGRIFPGSFEDYPVRSEFFDVITLQDVFDHMPNPIATLEKCRDMLKPKGLLAVKVHNISCLYAKLSGRNFYAIVPPSHLFYYDKSTLQAILDKAGFRMVDSLFIAHRMKVQTVLWRLSRNDIGSLAYRTYAGIRGTWFGNIKIRKNLHDIITVVATRDSR
jgi:2-polyprenyl-3-methyl-5-hydroxy-6-metoxy-1,4-benzoquinol methylase